jgi:hypothetical protein
MTPCFATRLSEPSLEGPCLGVSQCPLPAAPPAPHTNVQMFVEKMAVAQGEIAQLRANNEGLRDQISTMRFDKSMQEEVRVGGTWPFVLT